MDAIHDMAGHVAERSVAEIEPAMPAMGMELGMKIAIGRWADPVIPIHAIGHGELGRARAFAAVAAISPAIGLGDIAEGAGPDVFAKLAIADAGMALVAHLGDDL